MASIRWLFALSFLFLVSACGGGGSLSRDDDGGTGGGTGGTDPDPTLTVEVALFDKSTGEASNELSASTPLVARATITNADGNPVGDELVTFSLPQPNLAFFEPESGTAATDDDGIAEIELRVGDTAGAGTVVARVDSGEDDDTTFNSAGDGSSGDEQPASVELFTSSNQLASSGSDSIELIALAKDEDNVLMPGVTVAFSTVIAGSDNGVNSDAGELQVQNGGITGDDGRAKATLSTQANPKNRTIVARAKVGDKGQEVEIFVTGTEIKIDGPSSVVLGKPSTFFLSLVDSDGKGISQEELVVEAQNGEVSKNSVITDTTGKGAIQYTSLSSGDDVIEVSALNATARKSVTVQEDDFGFTSVPGDKVALGTTEALSVTWLKDGNPFSNAEVLFTTSRGYFESESGVNETVTTVFTDEDGIASVQIASTNAGDSSVTATGDDGSSSVTARSKVRFIATEAYSIEVDATPDSIGPDGQSSTISAVVRDINGNLVEDKLVSFVVDDEGAGNVEQGTALTDEKGIAAVAFTSTAVTGLDDVVVTASVVDDPAVSSSTMLTVSQRPYDVSFGTGKLITSPSDPIYVKEYAVFVANSTGGPRSNVLVTPVLSPAPYTQGGFFQKGYWSWDDIDEVWVKVVTATCPNEDRNNNGRLDDGEDSNGDQTLWPGIVGVLDVKDGQNITGSDGQVTLLHSYPKEFATWTNVRIGVEVESSGTESEEARVYVLPIAADDVTDENSPPPVSPYGTGSSCTDTN